jgi:hypothetical protein
MDVIKQGEKHKHLNTLDKSTTFIKLAKNNLGYIHGHT